MPDRATPQDWNPTDPALDEPLPAADDPGGAHAKGYSADPNPAAAVPDEGPLPLADDPDPDRPNVIKAEEDPALPPTGRREPGRYTPNERLMGSDR